MAKMEPENWTRRINQILQAVNEGRGADTIKPPLNETEMKSYQKHLAELEAEQKKINAECKAKGIKPWKAEFELLEVE